MALCLLLRQWYLNNAEATQDLGQHEHQLRVYSFHVDHSLRPESKEEASEVRHYINSLGVFKHRSLAVNWRQVPGATMRRRLSLKKHGVASNLPVTGVHLQARTERFQLLRKECLKLGVRNLLLAHHLEDQCETLLQRIVKSSGLKGLQCIPARRTLVRGWLT